MDEPSGPIEVDTTTSSHEHAIPLPGVMPPPGVIPLPGAAERVQVVEALVVRPGDHLLVSIRDHDGMTRDQVENLRDLLRERFPGVEVTLLAGASVVAHRGEG